MYMSKLSFHTTPRILGYNDANNVHKFVMSLFPSVEPLSARKELNILYRRELNHFLIQSDDMPDLLNVKNDSMRNSLILESKNIDDIYSNILDSETFSYKMRINPTIFQNGKRVPVKGMNNIQDWWVKKSSNYGFSAVPEFTSILIEQSVRRENIYLASSTITGIANVNDRRKILESIQHGIGRSKNYGFGLMLIGKA